MGGGAGGETKKGRKGRKEREEKKRGGMRLREVGGEGKKKSVTGGWAANTPL